MMQKAFDFDLQKSVGISWSQAKVIMTLAQKNGMAQKEIADGICIEAPTLVPIIDKMEREGLVERRQDEADRRNNRVYLTERSRSLQHAIDESIARVRKVAYKGIAKDDLDTTRHVLDMISKNVADYLESQQKTPVAEIQQKAARQ
ncbi:MarR family winged helix-turn-helix transcriptional regulator [Nitrososphaera viennensis]|uniref:MarR family transcriptional regulator n=2 Tax=Nitrososphaera viennensis TaxID=1034015 RepID=A0A977NLM8_9ARCH|nr:MarR family transcriptional regulator [Nitrososphaera viennensis]AIC16999.1 putative transcriptional regulator [Nitrososphaera viennensis EN76]UVS68898.1 MarR family transcriptional regulator [Nitrososphaera viennensis]